MNAEAQAVFEKWLRTVCFQKPTPEAYSLAKEAWAEAYKDAARVCREQFEREPHASVAEVCAEAIWARGQ